MDILEFTHLFDKIEKTTSGTTGQEMKDLALSLAPATKFSGAGDEGVVITDVDPHSDAADKGLKCGDAYAHKHHRTERCVCGFWRR